VRGIYHQLIIFKVRHHPKSHVRALVLFALCSVVFSPCGAGYCLHDLPGKRDAGSARARRVQANASKRHQDTNGEENGQVSSLHSPRRATLFPEGIPKRR
jgi:hypothetical protein